MAEPASLPHEIARALRDDILRGRYVPGQRLPSERVLAADFGANRGSVREALVRLQQLRLIEIRRGGGARVAPLDQASLDVLVPLLELETPPDPVLVAQWLDVHELIVAGAVRLAVERASDAQIEEARGLLARLGEAAVVSDADLLATLNELAELISRASRNVVLRMVRNALRALFLQKLPARRRPPREALAAAAATVDRALAARDAVAAEEGVRQLLRAGRERLLKALESRTATAGPEAGADGAA